VREAPNREMVADWWVSPGGRGDGDDGGQKHTEEGHGGSVASVDERWLAWPCTEESRAEEKRARCGGRLI
jgi:hypothetical protein